MDLTGINEVNVVEETWGLKRPMENEWLEDLREQCKEQGVVFSLAESYLWGAN